MKFGHFSFGSIQIDDTTYEHDVTKREAARRHIELLLLPTAKAIERLGQDPDDTNAILHVTC
jgi:hypothetical protein